MMMSLVDENAIESIAKEANERKGAVNYVCNNQQSHSSYHMAAKHSYLQLERGKEKN